MGSNLWTGVVGVSDSSLVRTPPKLIGLVRGSTAARRYFAFIKWIGSALFLCRNGRTCLSVGLCVCLTSKSEHITETLSSLLLSRYKRSRATSAQLRLPRDIEIGIHKY